MKKILLTLLIIFTIIFSFGLSSMEAGMCEPSINIIMATIGLIGAFVTGFKLCIKLEDSKKERENFQKRQLNATKKMVQKIKLKDNGFDIDEAVKIVKEHKNKEK